VISLYRDRLLQSQFIQFSSVFVHAFILQLSAVATADVVTVKRCELQRSTLQVSIIAAARDNTSRTCQYRLCHCNGCSGRGGNLVLK